MILIIYNKNNGASVYIPADKMRALHVYQESYYGWDDDSGKPSKKEVKWAIEITVENEEPLCITVGDEKIARALANEIPRYIFESIEWGRRAIVVDVGKFIADFKDG